MNKQASDDFEPIFIVGNPRSGTTLLATLLSKHSKIAIPSETQFFKKVLSCGIIPINKNSTHKKLHEKLFSYSRTTDLNINKEKFFIYFQNNYESSYPGLFRALLEFYAQKEGKVRVGEKSPAHLFYLPHILQWYPRAKVIMLVRDGRDAVLSLMRVPWGHNNLKRHCAEWNYYSRKIMQYQTQYAESVLTVKYEDLLLEPRVVIAEILSFIGEGFEESQLATDRSSEVVANWEQDWKRKATAGIDSSRVSAWRDVATQSERILMNEIMGRYLELYGYVVEAERRKLPFIDKVMLFSQTIIYKGYIYVCVRNLREFIKKIVCVTGLREIENELPKISK